MSLGTVVDVVVMIGDGLFRVCEVVSWFTGEATSPTEDEKRQQIAPQPAPPDVTESYLD